NLSIKELVDAALTHGEGELASNQALVVKTGARTGRSPKDRFIVKDAVTDQQVNWNTTNQPLEPAVFDALWDKAIQYLGTKDTHYISHLQVGEHEHHGLIVKVMTELAWHSLFAYDLFIRLDNIPVN